MFYISAQKTVSKQKIIKYDGIRSCLRQMDLHSYTIKETKYFRISYLNRDIASNIEQDFPVRRYQLPRSLRKRVLESYDDVFK